MKRYASGPYLKVMVNFLTQTLQAHKRQQGTLLIPYVHAADYSPNKLSINTCGDGTRIRNIDQSGKVVSKGIALRLHLELRRFGGQWKLWNGDDKRVQSCLTH